jgi:hypothetical protein
MTREAGKQTTRNATRFETEKDSNLAGLTSNVGTTGIEPVTSTVSGQRSPAELSARLPEL